LQIFCSVSLPCPFFEPFTFFRFWFPAKNYLLNFTSLHKFEPETNCAP
jgi:hypothetical protein